MDATPLQQRTSGRRSQRRRRKYTEETAACSTISAAQQVHHRSPAADSEQRVKAAIAIRHQTSITSGSAVWKDDEVEHGKNETPLV
jgi:hypothetical protein